jgi:membrane protease YdiL (CAAX protease family)
VGVAVIGAFVAGLAVASIVLPSPPDGPAPPETRIAYYALFASFFIALALIPLGMWLVDRRAGRGPALAWRVVTAVGVTLAMLAVGWGVRTYAYPPHNLRQCFTDYRGNGHSGIWGRICESGLVNRPLGLRRLNEGIAGAFVVLVVTALVAARLAVPPAGPSATRRAVSR